MREVLISLASMVLGELGRNPYEEDRLVFIGQDRRGPLVWSRLQPELYAGEVEPREGRPAQMLTGVEPS